MTTFYKYLNFYSNFLQGAWRDITPMQYTYLLCGIAFIGWLLMRSNLK